jgi:hypothetical protein
MKTPLPPRALKHRWGRLIAPTLGLLVLLPNLPAQDASESAPKNYTLFVGLDVEVPWQEAHRPIRRLVNRNRSAEIAVDGEFHEVSINRSETLRLKRQLKAGREPAVIANLNTIRTYSAGNDPFRRWTRATIAVQSQAAERMDMAQFEYTQASLGTTNPGMHATGVAEIEAKQASAMNALMGLVSSAPEYDYSEISQRLSHDLAVEPYDAIEAKFVLSSPVPITDVFMVLLADYTMPGAPNDKRRLIFTRTLGYVSSEPRQETVWAAGLPFGFELVDTRIYLYSFGEEIPTNLSEMTVGVTREEAVQLLTADHLARHRGKSAPPEPLWLTAPRNFRARLDPADLLPRSAVLHLDAEGRVTAVLNDAGQPLAITGLARRVLTETRFVPALEQGTPVAGTLKVELRKFLR